MAKLAEGDGGLPLTRYRVEEYSALLATGRSWELNAPNPTHAVSRVTGRTAQSGVKRGALAFKVTLAQDKSSMVEWYHLSK
jgi:hypothetical protein